MAALPSLRNTAPWRVLDGFGISARAASRWVQPRSVDELANIIRRAADEDLKITFRGNGRSYGDAALNAGQLVVDNRGMTRVSKRSARAPPSTSLIALISGPISASPMSRYISA